jgi:putative ubiquitin-RnfH superfamily antitoxin RatB of RatAB toxin-antitoxin module
MPHPLPDSTPIDVIVAWAVPQHAVLRPLRVAPGTTIEQAITASGLLQEIGEIDLAVYPVGIYGKKKPLDTVLRHLDRIEIYRPLVADPKESRRRRAAHKAAAAG